MTVPPLSPNPSDYPVFPNEDPKCKHLYKLWDSWWNDPCKRTGEKLLHFLYKNEDYFKDLTDGTPPPPGFPPDTPFIHYYEAAENYLDGWIHDPNDPCDPNRKTPVSEWISDVYDWSKSAEG